MDPILIVGAGPTGLTAALELSRFGVKVRIVDKLAKPSTTSRAIGVQARTLELMGQRHLADAMVQAGNKAQGGSIYGGGARLFGLAFNQLDSPYNFLLLLSQAETERILTEALARHGVTVERGVALIALSQDVLSHDASPVQAVLRDAGGRLSTMRTPWLISAEGAHSVVRTTLNLDFEGKTLPDDYVLGDVRVDGAVPATEIYIFASQHGFATLFPLGPGHFRMIASDPTSRVGTDAPPTLDELQAAYDRCTPLPARFHDMAWSSWFRINSRMVPHLRVGRLLLGGDWRISTVRPAARA